MPIFEFVCDKCKEDFEELVFGAPTGLSCPKCGSSDVRRKPSAFAFKSGGKFVASGGSSCSGCSSSSCSGCGH